MNILIKFSSISVKLPQKLILKIQSLISVNSNNHTYIGGGRHPLIKIIFFFFFFFL